MEMVRSVKDMCVRRIIQAKKGNRTRTDEQVTAGRASGAVGSPG